MMENWIYKFIVFSGTKNKILLSHDGNGMVLPTYKSSITHVAVTRHINEHFEKNYQLKTNVLRCYRQTNNVRTYELEVLEERSLLSSETSWVVISDLNVLNELSNDDKSLLKDWLSSSKSPAIPWFKVGWREEMEKWVKRELSNNFLKFEQIRSWERSALFRIISDSKNFYFKAVPDVFSHEPLLSSYLYQNHPSYVPVIVKVEPEQRWYLMEELHGDLLGKTDHIAPWRQALLRLATIQKKSILHRSELKKLKCPVRPVSKVIKNYLEKSLSDLYNNKEIDSETYNKLITSFPIVLSMCDLLETSKIPLALEHGDFFGGNIITHNNNPIIYDWSDCTLSHPFLSTIVFLEEVEQLFSDEIAKSLLYGYLGEWSSYDPNDRLHEEYRLLKSIAPVYYLTIYQTFIFPTFDDNWDKQQILDHYIKKWLTILQS
jgi:hypothetical protein